MTNKIAATRYARALLDVAIKETADLDQIDRDLDSVAELFKQYPALAHALLNPVVPVSRKRAATAELTALARLTPIVTKLIGLLADRDLDPPVEIAAAALQSALDELLQAAAAHQRSVDWAALLTTPEPRGA